MNAQLPIVAVVFFVALGAIVVAQQLELRSVRYEIGVLDRDSRALSEEIRVHEAKLASERDPRKLFERARALKIPLLPPEVRDEPARADNARVQGPGRPTNGAR
jgi:hypothetical protein